jgi:hypothetical protein
MSLLSLPTVEELDQVATIDLFCRRIFPQYIALWALGVLRLMIGLCAWSLTLYLILGPGWDVNPNYKPSSLLRRRIIKLRRFATMYGPFTSWCWLMLGTSFSLNGFIVLAAHAGRRELVEPWMLRAALILWELSAPFSLLVSAVIRWAIWPVVEAGGKPHNLAGFRNQMQHNANSILTLSEAALLGGLPVIPTHIALSTFVGIVYVLFSWVVGAFVYGDKDNYDGPQYLYWFFDVTLGRTTTIALVALLFALTVSFGIFVGVETIIQTLGGKIWTNLAIVVAICGLVCRFRPSKVVKANSGS